MSENLKVLPKMPICACPKMAPVASSGEANSKVGKKKRDRL